MPIRGTRTGAVLERTVLPILIGAGYGVSRQVEVGKRPGGARHLVDVVATRNARRLLVSLKWQQVPGTAEQKVPFEIICLAEAVAVGGFERAYLVLGGEGWKLREYFTSGELRRWLNGCEQVDVVTLERFIALANQGRL